MNRIGVGEVARIAGVLPGVDGVRFETARQARRAVEDREVYGAPDGKEQVLTGPAASFTVSSSLTQAAVEAQAKPFEVVPLDDGDPRGTVFNLLIVPLVVTGLPGAQLATRLIKDVPVRRRLLTVGGVAVPAGFASAPRTGPTRARWPAPFARSRASTVPASRLRPWSSVSPRSSASPWSWWPTGERPPGR